MISTTNIDKHGGLNNIEKDDDGGGGGGHD